MLLSAYFLSLVPLQKTVLSKHLIAVLKQSSPLDPESHFSLVEVLLPSLSECGPSRRVLNFEAPGTSSNYSTKSPPNQTSEIDEHRNTMRYLLIIIHLHAIPSLLCSAASLVTRIPEDPDCCEWDHVPTLPDTPVLDYTVDELYARIDSIDDMSAAREHYRTHAYGPDHATEYLRKNPDIDVHERMIVSLQGFDASPRTGYRLMWLAAEAGHTPVLKALLEAGASPLGLGDRGEPTCRTLVTASMRGDVESVELLIKAGLDPNMPFEGGQDLQPDWYTHPEAAAWQHDVCKIRSCGWKTSPIYLAIENNRTALVNRLLQTNQIDLTERGKYGGLNETAFELAARIGHLPTFELLMEYMAGSNVADHNLSHHNISSLLYNVGKTGDLEMVRYALGQFGFPSEYNESSCRSTLLADRHHQMLMDVLYGGLSDSRATAAFIQHLLDYLHVPGKSLIPELLWLGQWLEFAIRLAIWNGDVDTFALFTKLERQRVLQTHDSANSSFEDGDKDLHILFRTAIKSDSVGVVRYLIEDQRVNPNEAVFGPVPKQTSGGLGTRRGNALEEAILKRSWKTARYFLEDTEPDISGRLFGQRWRTPLLYALGSAGFSWWFPSEDTQAVASIVYLLLRRGGPVSSISPAADPDFEKPIVVDVVRHSLSQTGNDICLCWGYKDTIRPKPEFATKNVVRVELRKEDEEWWAELKKMRKAPTEPDVNQNGMQ